MPGKFDILKLFETVGGGSSIQKMACLNCQVSVDGCIVWGGEGASHWQATAEYQSSGLPGKLAQSDKRPAQRPRSGAIGIFLASLRSHKK